MLVTICALAVFATGTPVHAASVDITVLSRSSTGKLQISHEWATPQTMASVLARLDASPHVIASGISQSRRLVADSPTTNDKYSSSQWGWQRLGGTNLSHLGSGAGITVAVIDTGVDAGHEDLGGRVLPGRDFVDPTKDGRFDPNGHGTHVAGIIAATRGNDLGVTGVAPDVQILPVRVLDENGNGDDTQLALGIVWAVDNGVNIINLSIGGAVPSTLLEGAIDYALAADILVVVAAGNWALNGNEPSYPAAYTQSFAVGATESNDRRAMYSNTGSYIDIAAPGSWIMSTWPGNSYFQSSGTSMAAPFVAAAAALVQANTGVKGRALGALLVSGALDLGSPGYDNEFGAGLINPLAAIGESAPLSPTPTMPDLVMPRLDVPLLAVPVLSIPTLPTLSPPTVPVLSIPTLPTLPILSQPSTPVLPSLPTLPRPTNPVRSPDTPNSPSLPAAPLFTVRVSASTIQSATGAYIVHVVLHGARPLVALQMITVTSGSLKIRTRTTWDGKAVIRLLRPAGSKATVTLASNPLVQSTPLYLILR